MTDRHVATADLGLDVFARHVAPHLPTPHLWVLLVALEVDDPRR